MFNIYSANTSRYFNTELHSYYQFTVENLLDQFPIYSNTCCDLVFISMGHHWNQTI